MNISKRNPLLRNNNEEFNKVIGSLGEEIQDQNLENIDGGSSPGCGALSFAVATWINDKITAKIKCGGVWTLTHECQGC